MILCRTCGVQRNTRRRSTVHLLTILAFHSLRTTLDSNWRFPLLGYNSTVFSIQFVPFCRSSISPLCTRSSKYSAEGPLGYRWLIRPVGTYASVIYLYGRNRWKVLLSSAATYLMEYLGTLRIHTLNTCFPFPEISNIFISYIYTVSLTNPFNVFNIYYLIRLAIKFRI